MDGLMKFLLLFFRAGGKCWILWQSNPWGL